MTPRAKTVEPLLQPGRLQKQALHWRELKKLGEDSTRQANKERDTLKGFIQRHGEPDSDGSYWVELDEPIALPGLKPFNALKNQRSVRDDVDPEAAEGLLTELGLFDEVFDMVPTLNEEKLDKLYREGKIPKRVYNRIVHQVESFSLVPSRVE